MDAGPGGNTTLSNSTRPYSSAPKLVPKCRKAFACCDFDAPKFRRRTDREPFDNCPIAKVECQPLPPLTTALSQARVPGWEMDAGLGGKTTLSNSTQPSSPAPKLVPKCRKAFVFRDFDAPKSRRRTDGDPLDNCPMAKVECSRRT